jgi:hypothetical protein
MYRESFEGGLTPKLWFDPTVIGTPFNVCSGHERRFKRAAGRTPANGLPQGKN